MGLAVVFGAPLLTPRVSVVAISVNNDLRALNIGCNNPVLAVSYRKEQRKSPELAI